MAEAFGQPSIAGSYWVQGTNPGGKGAYKGIATIVKAGDSYRMHWEVGTIYEGIGKLNGNVFTVEWGTIKENVGTVTYTLQTDGSLKGTWFVAKNPSDLGTETLNPKK
jgi:hypothetical protein